MPCGNGGVREGEVTFPFKDKRLRAVAASVLMRRHSSEPMATSGMEWTSKRGILWKALWNFCYKFTFVADATSVTVDLLYDCGPGN